MRNAFWKKNIFFIILSLVILFYHGLLGREWLPFPRYPWLYISYFFVVFLWLLLQEKLSIRASYIVFASLCAVNILICDIPEQVSPWLRLVMFLIMSAILMFSCNDTFVKYRQCLFDLLFKSCSVCVLASFVLYICGVVLQGTKEVYHGVLASSMALGPISGLCFIYSLKKLISSRRKERFFYVFMSLVCFLMVLASASKIALACTLVGGGVLVWFSPLKKFFSVLALAGVFLLIFYEKKVDISDASDIEFIGNVVTKIENNIEVGGGVLSSREQLWNDRLREIKQHPLIGVGFCSLSKGVSPEGVIEAGNGWMFTWSSLGIFGFILMLYLWWGTTLKLCLQKNKTLDDIMILSVLFLFIIHNFAESYLFSAGSPLFFIAWLTLGIANDRLDEYNKLYPVIAKKSEQVEM